MFVTVLTTITTIWRLGFRGLIKFYTSIIGLNRLSDLLVLTQKKALLKVLIKTFLQKCILNADTAFIDFAVETKCKVKISGKLLN